MPPKASKSKEVPAERAILGRFSSHLKIGIVGLPNVGKSTLFNTLTKLSIPAENFPCLSPKSEVAAFLEIHDIAGLVRGAHQGQGLGNSFLSHIRAVDGIFHVLRAFEDPDIIHVDDIVDPVRDLEVISAELRLKDIEFIERRIEDVEKSMKRSNDKQLKIELELCQKVKAWLEEEKDVRLGEWKAADIEILNTFQLLTAKPVVYLVNMNEKDYQRKKNKFLPKIHAWVQEHGGETIIPFSCVLERTLADMLPHEADKYCEENKVQSCLPKIIKTGFSAINLIYFFTAGPDEVKCWQIRRHTKAPQAAGAIHTDFERGFICAEVMKFDDLKEHGSESAVKAAGKYKQEGKTYVVQDGDIIFFKFNVSGGGKKNSSSKTNLKERKSAKIPSVWRKPRGFLETIRQSFIAVTDVASQPSPLSLHPNVKLITDKMANFSQAHICQCLTRLSTLRSTSVVTISGNRQKTGHQFVEDVLSLAHGLLLHGLRNGDIVAICGFNSDWYMEWLLAVAFVGGIFAPLNYRWSFEEAKSAILMVRPVMLVTDESCSPPSSGSVKTSNVLTTETLRNHVMGTKHLDYSWAPEGAVIICFTSGTTGRPKGVIISHSAMIVQSLAKVAVVGYSEDDVYLHTAPLCHIGGLSSAITMLMAGGCHVLIPKFEASLAMEAIKQHCVTSLITVPSMIADLVSLTRLKETWKGRHYVKKLLNGGGSLSAELIRDAIELFPRAKLLSAYGMTETCSSLTFMTLHDPTLQTPTQTLLTVDKTRSSAVHQRQGVCVGKPPLHVELKIGADEPSTIGRILTRGDIGSIDDYGNIWLVGRQNGPIKSGGENIYPEEVEAMLLQHPGVLATVVVGIPEARLTEMVVACIKLRESWQWIDKICKQSAENNLTLSREILGIYCREKNLTGFKVPKLFILWRKPFPLTTTGKIRRDQVRREVMSHLQLFPKNLCLL
ncbi:OBG-LIKE ATPASE 1 [Salix viminalis]|uniref:Ribosome-binding ATPase YchF n=1 Tax=Salix viminalis TaxID=40686 RepID=A0A9Q0Z7F9_SALVM|nr:OBG-LIKE ATPASE 1 [Salix viminalis]